MLFQLPQPFVDVLDRGGIGSLLENLAEHIWIFLMVGVIDRLLEIIELHIPLHAIAQVFELANEIRRLILPRVLRECCDKREIPDGRLRFGAPQLVDGVPPLALSQWTSPRCSGLSSHLM